LPQDAYDSPFHREDIAGALALAGLKDESLKLVEGLLSERAGPTRAGLQLDPFLKSLHDESRWQDLMAAPAN